MNTNCTVYKLGLDLYRTQDKNSGLHEYDIIQDAVKIGVFYYKNAYFLM